MDIAAVGGIVFDRHHRLLLIRRGRPPGAALWSVPGGKCLPGEPAEEACVRELREETGLNVRVLTHAGRVMRPVGDGNRFVIDDYVCATSHIAEPVAGDDADAVGWFSAAELRRLDLVPLLLETLQEWGQLPR